MGYCELCHKMILDAVQAARGIQPYGKATHQVMDNLARELGFEDDRASAIAFVSGEWFLEVCLLAGFNDAGAEELQKRLVAEFTGN